MCDDLYTPENWHILKIDGWKMKFRFKMAPFSGDMLKLRGVGVSI